MLAAHEGPESLERAIGIKPVTVRLDRETRANLDTLAKFCHSTRQDLLNDCVQHGLMMVAAAVQKTYGDDEMETAFQETLKALEDAEDER